MWVAKPLQILALALLVFLAVVSMAGMPARALEAPVNAATDVQVVSARACAPPGAREPELSPGRPAPERAASSAAADAPPSIGERRARAVAMTVFSLGAVIGAGFLVGFLIKRLL